MTRDELRTFFVERFPAAAKQGFEFVTAGTDGVELALDTREDHLRPGGMVSGPTLMHLADTAMYASILARLGPEAIGGLTSSLEIHFLRAASPGRLKVGCRLLKVGRRLAIGTVEFADADGRVCAHATVTYVLQ